MTLDEIATYIAANSTFAVGVDLFKNEIPATAPDTAVGLYESGGIGPALTFGGVAYESPSIQVLVRSTSTPIAKNQSQVIWNLMVGISNSTLSGVEYIAGRPQQSPFSVGNDDKNRSLYSCNYFAEKEVSST